MVLFPFSVIENGLAKHLCLKTFPQLSSIISVVNANEGTMMPSVNVETKPAVEWEGLKRDHKVYASLLQAITKSKVSPKDCIANAVSASSTDNYPDESVVNTLNPRDRFIRRASYWSSKGQSNPEVPETLIYKLRAGIWVITEVDIQPFEGVCHLNFFLLSLLLILVCFISTYLSRSLFSFFPAWQTYILFKIGKIQNGPFEIPERDRK